MNDQWTNRLSEYLDGELDTNERVALEAHLATCADCRATLGELRQVVARAKALEDTEPATDLWFGIRARMTPGHRPGVNQPGKAPARRVSFSVPQLLAATITLVLVSAGGAWLAVRSGESSTNTADEGPVVTSPAPTTITAARWKVQSDMAIAELQDALALNEGKLDTATVRVVRENLAIIDRAIAQAQKALKRDPGSTYLNLHLANTMRQKIELLRRANALATRES